MREAIYSVIGDRDGKRRPARIYNTCAMMIALLSTLPLMFKNSQGLLAEVLGNIDTFTVYLLFLDYILCWMTSDYRKGRRSIWTFIFYPVTPLALLNLLSILPSLGLLPSQFAILRLFRLLKVMQYSKSCAHIVTVFKKEWKTLLSVLVIALFYIFISALVMYVEEPTGTFNDFFHALYWATTALTTVGYGDVYPVTNVGRFISMVSSLFGIAVIALPAGIVTAGFVDVINEDIKQSEEKKLQEKGIDPKNEQETDLDLSEENQELKRQLATLQMQQVQILETLQKMEVKQNDKS